MSTTERPILPRGWPRLCSGLAITLVVSLVLWAPCVSANTEPANAPIEEPGAFSPFGRQYTLIREELGRYRALASERVWQPLAAGQVLVPGMRDPRVRQLRGLLMQYGDYPLADHTDGTVAAEEYDQLLLRAVQRFKRRHGLKEDGLVDERTRTLLNIDPAYRARTLAANLQRWREMPKDLGPRYILINIPDFSLRLIEGERERFHMRVIVGREKHKTPRLATRMTRLVFNPIWRVPPSIAVHELLPKGSAKLRADGYRLVNWSGRTVPFTARNIAATRLGSVSLQQKGGPGNALGRIKFVIPNHQAIFLHDTNSKHLFKQSQRAFSHGCIRLEKPLEFAQMMLAEQNNWGEERIARYIASSRTRAVELAKPIPVYITYWSAWVDEEGLLQFRPDIYGLDQPQNPNEGETEGQTHR